jgi:hypothetical protein
MSLEVGTDNLHSGLIQSAMTDFRDHDLRPSVLQSVNPMMHDGNEYRSDVEANDDPSIIPSSLSVRSARVRVLQWFLALVGASFRDSPGCVYALQVFAVLWQLVVVWYIGDDVFKEQDADDKSSNSKSQYEIWAFTVVLIMLAPLAFLHRVTRSEKHSADLLAAAQCATLKRWYLCLFLPPLAIATTYATTEQGFWGFMNFLFTLVWYFPAAVGVLVCCIYAQSFCYALPQEQRLEDVKESLPRIVGHTQERIDFLNNAFVVPNIALWLFMTTSNLWSLWEVVEGEIDDDWSYTDDILYYSLVSFFASLMMLAFLLPPSEYTSGAENYCAKLMGRHCGDPASVGYILWLKDQSLGWAVLLVRITRQIVGRAFYVLVVVVLMAGSKLAGS